MSDDLSVVAHLLKPRGWKPPVRRQFFLDCNEISELCDSAKRIFTSEPTALQIKAPVKIFCDLHGQFGDLMRLFDEYGAPSTVGDISENKTESEHAWHRINRLFNWLPLAALMEKKVICMHGGISHSINHVEQIENLQRPIIMETGAIVLMDLLWSDPTENDSVEGLRPNARGPGLVTFGEINANRPATPTRGRPQVANDRAVGPTLLNKKLGL
ncbi:hypothetical protein ZIOFF_065839 [Zingiber officinale]|uniref:Serine/threonine specific protein phosphatases domain-containing protein n=1 Tax=Zingiber officinale TaxID=94328 RepID=A0A8J5K7A3_ZINOF|nr:hypothetical protein ZIOFF_065839 [Zingiber officinale]